MNGNEVTAKEVGNTGDLLVGLNRAIIGMTIQTTEEQKALRGQVGKLQTRNEQLVGQTTNLQRSTAIEKSKATPVLKTLARIRVILNEIPLRASITELLMALTEIRENLDPFVNCNGDFNRYVAEYTAERATIKAVIAARVGATSSSVNG